MAALSTLISSVVEPIVSSAYVLEQSVARNRLIQSGICGTSPEIEVAKLAPGRTVYLPFWDDLANDPDTATTLSTITTQTDDEITASGVTADKDIAVKQFRAKRWNVPPLITYATGQDPAQVFADRVVNWNTREDQRILLKSLAGAMGSTAVAAALTKDYSCEVGATTDAQYLIDSTKIEYARFLLGDCYDKFTAMAMHSTVFARLRALGLVEEIPVNDQDPMGGTRKFYMGLEVLVDDNITKTATTDAGGYKYDTFLFGKNAVALTNLPMVDGYPEMQLYYNPLQGSGAGNTSLLFRKYFIMHPRGITWSGTASGISPTDAELATVGNWTQVALTKNIRIARLRTNG